MEYKAKYGIDGGVSPGFGVKYPDYIVIDEKFSADDEISAYHKAMSIARKLSIDHLSNPETGYTIVKLFSVTGPRGEIHFDLEKSIAKCSWLEKLLLLSLSKDEQNGN